MQKLITEGTIDIPLTSFYELMTTLGLVAKERRARNEKYFLRHITTVLKDQPFHGDQQKDLYLPFVQLHLDIISHITKANAYKSTANRESSKLDVTPSRTSGDI